MKFLSVVVLLSLLMACNPMGGDALSELSESEDSRSVQSSAKQDLTKSENEQTLQRQSLVLGLGCFWGAEKRFEALPGVLNVVSGYADGRGLAPSYKEIVKLKNRANPDNYAEVIKVEYNQSLINTETLLKIFFEIHDPTQKNQQGNDIGTNYRSTILVQSEEQALLADRIKDEFQSKLSAAGFGDIQTVIKPLDKFHPAEEYHQDYIAKNPNGYCPDHSNGVTFGEKPLLDKYMDIDEQAETVNNQELLSGQHIVVIDAPNCPYCEKFKEDVSQQYNGDIPMHFRMANQLQDLTVKSPTFGTPTILFMEDGVEQLGHVGYMSAKKFYKALGAFELGDTEAFQVAFNKSTDNRFCKAYEKFKDTPSGTFVDRLSGKPLFDTKDRFNSGTGWLSFKRPITDAVTYHEDLSFGMQRTEVRAKVSGIHLGHVFNDGPNGSKRYCINATVLDFEPRKKS